MKYAGVTISTPVSKHSIYTAAKGVNNMKHWADSNKMTLNLSKTWEMLIHSKTARPNPPLVPGIERKSWLKLLDITFQENPCRWDINVDNLIAKTSSRLYILESLQILWLFSRPTRQVI